MQASTLPPVAAPLSKLLTRYMGGQIADTSWSKLMRAFDADDLTAQERLAMANFFNEVLEELGPRAVNIPRPEEMQALLTDTRA